MLGPGKYDEHCTRIREETGARAVIVIVIDGSKGSGFSMQEQASSCRVDVASVLQRAADEIRADMRRTRA